MRISRTCQLAIAAQSLFCAGLASADTATFGEDTTKLSGQLKSIREDGIIEWVSPFSKDPLKLKTDKLREIVLTGGKQTDAPSPVLVTLSNGDKIPASEALRLNGEVMQLKTSFAGLLDVPRHALSSAQFGIHQPEPIYSGPNNIQEWSEGVAGDHWRLRSNKTLTSNRHAVAARKFELPRNFILKFRLLWSKHTPNFIVSFADPLNSNSNPGNSYRFHLDSSGMRIAREVDDRDRYRTLAQWQRPPSQYPYKVDVEIHVDRDHKRLELFLNGESEGLIADPIGQPPEGSGVSFSCQPTAGATQSISHISVLELNDLRRRHLAEDRGDDQHDVLITVDDDRWSGELMTIQGDETQPPMVFKPKFTDQQWKIPQLEVSTLFFAARKGPAESPQQARLLIEFHNGGLLKVNQCSLAGDQILAGHPLLGRLTIRRDGIRSIQRIATP